MWLEYFNCCINNLIRSFIPTETACCRLHRLCQACIKLCKLQQYSCLSVFHFEVISRNLCNFSHFVLYFHFSNYKELYKFTMWHSFFNLFLNIHRYFNIFCNIYMNIWVKLFHPTAIASAADISFLKIIYHKGLVLLCN